MVTRSTFAEYLRLRLGGLALPDREVIDAFRRCVHCGSVMWSDKDERDRLKAAATAAEVLRGLLEVQAHEDGCPIRVACPHDSELIACIAMHGRGDTMDYLTVAVQTAGMREGGRLLASRVFLVEDYEDPDQMGEDAIRWAREMFAVRACVIDGLLPPEPGSVRTLDYAPPE